LWLAAIQGIERKERLAKLTPQSCFIAAETIEREVGQISKTQEATCELDSMVDVRLHAEHFFVRCFSFAIGRRIAIGIDDAEREVIALVFARSTRESKQLLGTMGQRPAEFAGCLISLRMGANIRGCRQ
jgi:hypothetical protein